MNKKRKLRPIPEFKTEDEEREFWDTHDSTEYVDYSPENRVTIQFDPSYEPPLKLISIRLPRDMISKLKVMAIKRDVPYQSLIKMILAERLDKEAA